MSDVAERRRTVAVGCRILAHAGLAEDVLGHISVRNPGIEPSLLVRCRGPRELGLLHTEPDDVREVSFDGRQLDGRDDYAAPNELPIHTAVLRARPDVAAVVHAHPPAVVAADLAGLPLVPLIGSYHIPAAQLAAGGIPTYPRGVLIRRDDLADEMVAAMGDRPVCVLRGHGITAVGATVEQAVVRALAVDALARMICRVAELGGEIRPLPDDDLAELPDLGAGFNETLMWRHYEQRLRDAGKMIDDHWRRPPT